MADISKAMRAGKGAAKGEKYFSYKLSLQDDGNGEQNVESTGGWCVMHGRMGAEDLVKMQNFSPLPRNSKREAAVVPCCRAIVQKSWTRRVSTWIKWPIARGYRRSTVIPEKGMTRREGNVGRKRERGKFRNREKE